MPDELKNRCHQCRKPAPETDEEQVKRLREWVEKGKAWAQTMMAESYRDGDDGLKQSYVMAAMLFEKAVAQGDPIAMCNLACLYHYGQGVVQSDEKAVELYTMAAEKGDVEAMYNLASLYDEGEGVDQSDGTAIQYYTMAAELGHVDAMINLAVMYKNGQGVPQSNNTAREWYTKARDAGDKGAIEELRLLDAQEGKLAAIEKAVEQGDLGAMYDLALLYRDGRGVGQSYTKAAELFIKAVAGFSSSCGCCRWFSSLFIKFTTSASSSPSVVCCSSCNTPQPTGHTFPQCMGCRTAQYCNKECQRTHWRTGGHKQECKRLRKKREEKGSSSSSSSQNKKSK